MKRSNPIKLARIVRELGRPLWRLNIAEGSLWSHLSRLLYSLPGTPQNAQGHTLWFPKGYQGRLDYLDGAYEPQVTQTIMSLVKPGMTVIDGGANIGYYTLLLSHLVGYTGKVYAFEPDPKMHRALQENISRNRLLNVEAFELALGQHNDTLTFHTVGGVSSGAAMESVPNENCISVQMVALDQFLPTKQVDFVKLDIEGLEIECLLGMSEIIANSPNLCCIFELNTRRLRHSAEVILTVLRRLGFCDFYVIERSARIRTPEELRNVLMPLTSGSVIINLLVRKYEGGI